MAYTQTQVHDDIIALLTQVAYCPHWVHDDSMILPANVCWWSLSSSLQQIVLVCHSCGRLEREREKVPLENVMCIPSILVVYVIWPVILLYVSAGYVVSSMDKEDWVPWIAVGFANSCSAFYKPQAMININDCAIQSFSFCCNYIHVLWFGKPRTIIFANPAILCKQVTSATRTTEHKRIPTTTCILVPIQ